MLIAMLAALFTRGPGAPELLMTLDSEVRGLVWTRDQRLIVVGEDQVAEWPSNRRAIHSVKLSAHPWPGRVGVTISPDGERAIGSGFLLDLTELSLKPLDQTAVWIGNEVGLVDQTQNDGDGFTIGYGKKSKRFLEGHYLIAISADARYAMVFPQANQSFARTYLMELDVRGGTAKRIFSFPAPTYDSLTGASLNRALGKWLVHGENLAAPFYKPFLAGPRLVPITLPKNGDLEETSCHLEWIRSGSPWTLAKRRFFEEDYATGLDSDVLELYNVRTRSVRSVLSITCHWTTPDAEQRWRVGLSAYALDSQSLRLAYAVWRDGRTWIYVLGLPATDLAN